MNTDVTILAALLGGLLSFLSPCVLPLVPPYLVYLAGSSLERVVDAGPGRRVRGETVVAALLFIAGFSTVFIALGASATLIGALVRTHLYVLSKVAGVVIVIMGLHFLGITPFAFLNQEKRIAMVKPVGLWGAYAMGLAFAFGWSPCIGPILTPIYALAAAKDTVATGAGLLAVYSIGLGIPFLIAAVAVEPFAEFVAKFRRHLGVVEKVMGGLLVLTGIGFAFTNAFTDMSSWLMEWFPWLGKIG